MTLDVEGKESVVEKHAVVVVCPECGCQDIIHDHQRGELVCTGCGMVLSEGIFDHRPGTRAFTREERERRCINGLPLSQMLPDYGLSTTVSRRINGSTLSPERMERLGRIMRLNSHSSWRRRNFTIAFTEVRRLAEKLSLPGHVKETSAIFYRKAFKHDLLRGHSIKAMVAACIFAACKTLGFPVTFDSILLASGEEERVIKRCYVLLVRTLNLKPRRTSLTQLVPRFANALGLTPMAERKATEYLALASERLPLSGKDPKGYVAAAIYLAAKHVGEPRSQQVVAAAVGITEVTLRSRCREISKVIATR